MAKRSPQSTRSPKTVQPITVFLADDHTIVREGLRYILQAQGNFTVVGEAADGNTVVEKALLLKPQVIVMDISMPGLNGIQATQQIRRRCPATQVVILSVHATTEHILHALQAGALGYLLKESAGSEVVEAIRTVQIGQRYLSQTISETVITDLVNSSSSVDGRDNPLDSLSPRERQVLQWIAEGKSNAEIAQGLALSIKTVETYRSRLMKKLDLADFHALIRFAVRYGLSVPP